MNIMAFGEINFDVILRDGKQVVVAPGRETLVDDFTMMLGSSTSITTAGLIRLGNQGAFVGWVGSDASGDFCLNSMTTLGIDVLRVRRHPSIKTSITVSLSSPEDRSLISYLGTIPELRGEHIEDRFFAGFDHVHSSSYFLQTGMQPTGFRDVFARAHQHGLTTSLDPACDPQLRWQSGLRETLSEVDVFLPNESELRGITGEAEPEQGLRSLEGLVKRTVVKLGREGAMTLEDGRAVCVAAPSVEVLDPTGAGDNFNSGFIHAWLHGRQVREALQLGVACGSYSVRGIGGTGAQATEPEAWALLNEMKGCQ
jgi:sugar/nucleoside kinase (ribokinase family)